MKNRELSVLMVELSQHPNDIAAAWRVVDHFVNLRHSVRVESVIGGWSCTISGVWGSGIATEDTVTEAIRRAALQAIEVTL